MTYVITDMAEAQAIGLCWIARQPGLPDIHTLREAAVAMHPAVCAWCDYPLEELIRMLDRRDISDYAEKQWWQMPGKARLRAIELAGQVAA